MSNVSSASSVIDVSANVVGVAAVVLVFSPASIESLFTPNIEVPFSFISTVTKPEEELCETDALGI